MIEIEIAGIRRKEHEADESWINQQINRRRADGLAVCVRIFIKSGALNFIISSQDCPQLGRSKKSTTQQEQAIIDLWDKCKLATKEFQGGNLISFIKQVSKYL
jgi:hypothetical protein